MPKCAFLNFIRGKIPTWGSFCNLLLHLPSEHIINPGEWNDGEQQHEPQPSHSVLFNCLRRIHGSCFIAEDYERAGVCEGKLPPPFSSETSPFLSHALST